MMNDKTEIKMNVFSSIVEEYCNPSPDLYKIVKIYTFVVGDVIYFCFFCIL